MFLGVFEDGERKKAVNQDSILLRSDVELLFYNVIKEFRQEIGAPNGNTTS